MHTSVPTLKALTRAPALTATPQTTMEGIAMVRITGGGGGGGGGCNLVETEVGKE